MVTNINKGTNGFGKVIAPHVRITGYMNIMNLHRSYICFLRRPWFLGSSGSLGSCARESQEATDRDNRNQGNTTDRLHGDRGPYHCCPTSNELAPALLMVQLLRQTL